MYRPLPSRLFIARRVRSDTSALCPLTPGKADLRGRRAELIQVNVPRAESAKPRFWPPPERDTLVLDPKRTALALAILFACWHLFWSALVLIGWAQAIIDFIFWMHFIRTIYVIEPFSAGRALTLIAVTSALGALIGYSFARLWNRLHRRHRTTQTAADYS